MDRRTQLYMAWHQRPVVTIQVDPLHRLSPTHTDNIKSNWRKKMASLRKQFEVTIKELKEVLALNIKEQKDIKSLRDQLFSGTSVKESREAIKQNDNIKLLTLVTIFFLPLTFVSLPLTSHTNLSLTQYFR